MLLKEHALVLSSMMSGSSGCLNTLIINFDKLYKLFHDEMTDIQYGLK